MTRRSDPLLYQDFLGVASIYFSNGEKIKIDNVPSTAVNTSPSWYSVKLEDFTNLTNTKYFKNFKNPYLIYHNGFECPQMSVINYSTDEVDMMNRHGLHIFLTENLVKYTGDRNFISKKDISSRLAEFKPGINFSVYGDLRCSQFDSIQDLVSNNNLTNVHVYTIEMNVGTFFNSKYPTFKFHWKDTYISEPLGYILQHPSSSKNAIKIKFINLNWRYDFHRELVAAYLTNTSSKISWYYKSSFEKLKSTLWFDIEQWSSSPVYSKLKLGAEHLYKNAPLIVDKTVDEGVELSGTMFDILKLPKTEVPYTVDHHAFDNVFCSVVSESVYTEPTSTASEKTLYSIYHRTPFIIVGTPGALEYIKKLGFKTFEDYWPEDYDREPNHEHRLLKIFKLIDYLDSRSLDELEKLYLSMQPILDFNYNRLLELNKNNLWLEDMQ